MDKQLLGGIEAGGTKFVCSVGTADLTIVERVSFPTTTPDETMR
jgi:fructokinase